MARNEAPSIQKSPSYENRDDILFVPAERLFIRPARLNDPVIQADYFDFNFQGPVPREFPYHARRAPSKKRIPIGRPGSMRAHVPLNALYSRR